MEKIPKPATTEISEDKDKGITRRDFLKATAAIIAIDSIGLSVKTVCDTLTPERELLEEGLITIKKFIPQHTRKWKNSDIEIPDTYVIRVQTSRGNARVEVSKEEFDKFNQDETVRVKFKRYPIPGELTSIPRISEGLGVESIEQLNKQG